MAKRRLGDEILNEAKASEEKARKAMVDAARLADELRAEQLDGEQRRHADAAKNLRKTDRRVKELQFQATENHKNQERMQDLVDKLRQKLKIKKNAK